MSRAALLAVLALAAPGAWADAPTSPAPAAAPRIVVEPTSFDFGSVRPGGEVQKEFVIRNHGRAELVIQSISTDCGCTAALSDTKTVRAGGSTVMRVTLHAPADLGRLRKTVLVKSNDPARAAVEVQITATVAGRTAPGHVAPGVR